MSWILPGMLIGGDEMRRILITKKRQEDDPNKGNTFEMVQDRGGAGERRARAN